MSIYSLFKIYKVLFLCLSDEFLRISVQEEFTVHGGGLLAAGCWLCVACAGGHADPDGGEESG